MSISEQINELRIAAVYKEHSLKKLLEQAADTIESLSAKLQAANMEQITENKQDDYKHCEECGNFAPLPNGVRGGKRGHCKMQHRIDARSGRSRACKLFVEKKGQTVEDCGGWIPCSERLPEEDSDFIVTFRDGECVIAYLDENDKWVNSSTGLEIAIQVMAWHRLPPKYHEP